MKRVKVYEMTNVDNRTGFVRNLSLFADAT